MATKNIIVTGASRGAQAQCPKDIIHYLASCSEPEIERLTLRPFPTGIGHAIATHLLSPPLACNVLLAPRARGPLEDFQSAYPSQASYVSGDVSSPPIAESIVSQAVGRNGRLDGLVINHGILGQVGKISETNMEEWERLFAVNVTGTLRLIQAALPELRKTKGCIVFTSSSAAAIGYPTVGPYGATKSVLNHLALVLSKEEPDVTTVAVRPGFVDTDMVRGLLGDERTDEEVRGVRTRASDEGTMDGPGELGRVMARLVLGAGKDLSGEFVR